MIFPIAGDRLDLQLVILSFVVSVRRQLIVAVFLLST